MNIQINCSDKVEEDNLRYIWHNLPRLIKEYEENKNDSFSKKYINGRLVYYKHLRGTMMMSTNIDMTCNGKTMYFKLRSDNK